MAKQTERKWKVGAKDEASPFIHAANYCEAAGTLLRPIIGENDRSILVSYHNSTWDYALSLEGSALQNDANWTVKEEDWGYLGDHMLSIYIKDRKFIDKLYLEQKKTCNEVVLETEKARNTDLKKLSTDQLSALYLKIYGKWLEMNKWGDIPNLTDFEHFKLTNKVVAFLEKRVAGAKSRIFAGEAYGILASAIERSNVQESEVDFFKLLAEIHENPKLEELFKEKEADGIVPSLLSFPKFHSMLIEHVLKYDWLSYHYDGPTILDEGYFIDLLKSAINANIDGKHKIAEIENHEKELILRQKQLENELSLSDEERYWCHIARTLSYLKGIRKDTVFMGSRNTDGLIKEFGRRLSLSPRQVRHLHPRELKEALEKGSVDVNMVNERVNHCVTFVSEKGVLEVLGGKEALKYSSRIYEEEVNTDLQELKGTPAYPGLVTGIVRIIKNAEDMPKMQQGDILVSAATNPNLVPAMKKAGAIVTDEGGVTCHAAIVSRELKIPCVIGTKIATKWLKEGEKVEVDAVKGTIRKI